MVRLDGVGQDLRHAPARRRDPAGRCGGVTFEARAGECVVLDGPSGVGQVLDPQDDLRQLPGRRRPHPGARRRTNGWTWRRAPPRRVLAPAAVDDRLRQPVPAHHPARRRARHRRRGRPRRRCRGRGRRGRARAELLDRLNIPERLWQLPPSTFSGGEQQRINIARGFAAAHPILLLDEPTASLDRRNRAAVIDFIRERKRAGAALIGIFHDEDVKQQVGDRIIDVSRFRA